MRLSKMGAVSLQKIGAQTIGNASLQTKVGIPVIASVLIIVGLMTMLFVNTLTSAMDDDYMARGMAYIESFDRVGYKWDDYRGSARLQEHVENLKKSNQAIYRINVYSIKDGAPARVASSEREQIGKGADSHDLEPLYTDKTLFYDKVYEGEKLVEILAPLHVDGTVAASIGIYFRLAPRDADVANLVKTSVGIGAGGALLLLFVLNFVIRKSLIQPIVALEAGTLDLTAGHLNRRIDLSRGDELGRLANEFNRMAEVLEQNEKENLTLHQELEMRFQEARDQAGRDPLTGLSNHRTFQERLQQEIARAERFGHSLSLLFLDLDRFKEVNDTKGHQFGDTVLQQFGDLLKRSVRQVDVAARYGGEEFAIILPETDGEHALQMAERLRSLIEGFQFGEDAGNSIKVTVSIGVSSYPDEARDREDLVRKSDLAMYFAKQLGRNQVRLYKEITEHAEKDVLPDVEQTIHLLQQTVEDTCLNAVNSLAAAVDARDRYTHRHSQAVAQYAIDIARSIGYEGEQLREIGIAGLLHDIGKIGIPDDILVKGGPLTEEEWGLMRQHPTLGKMIVQQIASLGHLVPMIEHHQEKYDGTGYPAGLAGEKIPLGARILAVADAYNSMTTDRPYRRAMSHEEAVTELLRCAGTQFDPRLVEAFVRILNSQMELPDKAHLTTAQA